MSIQDFTCIEYKYLVTKDFWYETQWMQLL